MIFFISARFWAFFESCPASQKPTNTMDAIKKKMQAMKLEKDNAMDRADACEQQAKDANLRAERVKHFSKWTVPHLWCQGTSLH